MIPTIEYRDLKTPAMTEQVWRLIMADILEWVTQNKPIGAVTQAIEISRSGGAVELVVEDIKATLQADMRRRVEGLVAAYKNGGIAAKQEAWAVHRDGALVATPLYRAWDMLLPIDEHCVYMFLWNMEYIALWAEVKQEIERIIYEN